MKGFIQLLLVACVLIWSSSVFADAPGNNAAQSPESIVTCLSTGTHLVLSRSIAEPVTANQCEIFPASSSCATCITSLEDQGCEVVDVIVTNLVVSEDNTRSAATYLLSCDGR